MTLGYGAQFAVSGPDLYLLSGNEPPLVLLYSADKAYEIQPADRSLQSRPWWPCDGRRQRGSGALGGLPDRNDGGGEAVGERRSELECRHTGRSVPQQRGPSPGFGVGRPRLARAGDETGP